MLPTLSAAPSKSPDRIDAGPPLDANAEQLGRLEALLAEGRGRAAAIGAA